MLRRIVVPPENARILHRQISRSRLTLYGGAGHWLLFQYPQRFAYRVDAFLG